MTGGSGFFGRAFVEDCLVRGVPRICVFSRGEARQAAMRAELGDPSALRWFIGDVRDRWRLHRAMDGVDVVVHAAALKRIETGFYNPEEMVKTNVGGAMNVVQAATDAGVSKIIALSSDKAYQPISPYGQSKALAESIFLNANNTRGANGPKCSVVRYGNINGSTGSVIPKWREILNSSDTVPVTDPECTRFWMHVEEAVALVWDTILSMKGGELVIPELPAYTLADLAAAMGAKMEIVGLPAWEKKAECMAEGNCSETAKRMSVNELRKALENV